MLTGVFLKYWLDNNTHHHITHITKHQNTKKQWKYKFRYNDIWTTTLTNNNSLRYLEFKFNELIYRILKSNVVDKKIGNILPEL